MRPMSDAPSTPADPFAALGLPRRFDVNLGALQRAWLAETARLHPDRLDAPPDAAARLALLNESKCALEDPERRAAALHALLGGATKEQDKSLPDGFLMEMLELRQRMEEEVASEGDAARRRWEEWAAARRGEYIGRVGGMFAHGADAAALKAIRLELNAWRYIERLIEQLDPQYDPRRSDF
jgi:molecular chaperone HscB